MPVSSGNIEFNTLYCHRFVPHTVFNGGSGCGANALATITGNHPKKIDALNRKRDHFSDRFMLRYLHNRNFRVYPITKQTVTAANSCIGRFNIILLSQWMIKNEGSWVVIYDGKVYHNFERYDLSPYSLFNKPIMTAYCVYHKKYA